MILFPLHFFKSFEVREGEMTECVKAAQLTTQQSDIV